MNDDLPTPAQPGEELRKLRQEIGEMVRAEAEQWVYSDELDPDWPPSAKVYKRLYRKGSPDDLLNRYTGKHVETKVCSQCQKELPFKVFLIERNGEPSQMAYCNEC